MSQLRYVYLVEARPVNDAGEEQIQRWSCGDTIGIPYGGYEWIGCLLPAGSDTDGPFTYSAEIPLDTTVGGRSTIGYGSLRLATQYLDNQALTLLALLHWDARPVTLWRIVVDAFGVEQFGGAFNPATDEPLFVGTTDEPTWGVEVSTVPLFDRSRVLDVPLQETKYLGTGQLEGFNDLKGATKPLGIGRVIHAEPIALDHEQPDVNDDPYSRVFQFSDGAVDLINPPVLYERGLLLAVHSYGDVYAWSPVANRVVFDVANGVGRTGSIPAGVLGIWFVGNPENLLPLDGDGEAITTYANVLRAIVRLRGRVAADAIDEDALAALPTYRAGLYVQDDRTVSAALDQVTQSIGAAWTFTAAGIFTVRRIGFRVSVATLTADDVLSDIRPVALPAPVWRFRYGYEPVERVLGDTDIGLAQINATTRETLTRAFAYQVREAPGIRTVRPLAREVEVNSRSIEAGAASIEADRQARLLRQHRQQFVLPRVRVRYGALREGDTVTLQLAGFGLDAGKDFLVRRIDWRLPLQRDEDEAELTLWGPFVEGEDVRLAA